MRVSAFNNIYKSCEQNFTGLWGKTTKPTPDISPVYFVPVATTNYYYYPFSDEKENDINELEKKIDRAEITGSGESQKIESDDCRVLSALPFNQSQFEAYQKINENDELTNDLRKIHIFVQDKYLNREYGNQKPAINTIVAKRIEEENKPRNFYF